jgi:hypothetical protein
MVSRVEERAGMLRPAAHPWDEPGTLINVYLTDGVPDGDLPAWRLAALPRHRDGQRVSLDDLRAALLGRADCSGMARHLLEPHGGDDQSDDQGGDGE